MNEGSVNNDLGQEQFEALRLEYDQRLQESRAAGLSNEVLFYEGALNALARVEPIMDAVKREREEAIAYGKRLAGDVIDDHETTKRLTAELDAVKRREVAKTWALGAADNALSGAGDIGHARAEIKSALSRDAGKDFVPRSDYEALQRREDSYRQALERTERILCGMTPAFQGRVEMVARIQAVLRNSGV